MTQLNQTQVRRPYRQMDNTLLPAKATPLLIKIANGDVVPEHHYDVIKAKVGDVEHQFALHLFNGDWRVSDIRSGLRLITVTGYLQGMPVSASFGFTTPQIRHFAAIQIQAKAMSMGAEIFNAKVAAAAAVNECDLKPSHINQEDDGQFEAQSRRDQMDKGH